MSSWEKDLAAFLQQYKIPALLTNELSASLTFGAFAMLAASPDELAKTLQESLSSEAVATLTPFVLANMKAAWSAALATFASTSSGQPGSTTTSDAAKASSDVASWSDTFPPKLSASFTKQIITRFESSYPGDILDDSNTPSSRLLALCNKYFSDKSFKYIPWHLRLSEKTQEELSLHRPRKVPRLEDLLWEDVPSRDIPSNGISQMFLFHLLELVSIAYAMLEAAHLSSFRKYNKLFISLAFRKRQADVALCNPTVTELQQADVQLGRSLATFAFADGLLTMPFMRSWRSDVFCIQSCSLDQLLPKPFVLPRVVARARKASLHYLPAHNRNGSRPSLMRGGRSWNFVKAGTFEVVALARIVSSFINAASMSMASLACAITRLISTLEEATRSLGRLSSGRRYLSPLQICLPIHRWHRSRSSQCLLRLFWSQTPNMQHVLTFLLAAVFIC